MIFDQFSGFTERHEPSLVETIRQMRLFELPYQAHEVIVPGTFTPEDLDDFILPFPMAAFEDTASCVILIDSKGKQFGLYSPRAFIDIILMGREGKHFARHDESATDEQRREAKLASPHQIAFGERP